MIEVTHAAVVYAACLEAEWVFHDVPEVGRLYLRAAPSLRMRVRPEAAERFEDLFNRFCDDVDFLTLSDWQDMPTEHAEVLKRLMRAPDDRPLYAALERGRLSPEFRPNLRGLLSEAEIAEIHELDRRVRPAG